MSDEHERRIEGHDDPCVMCGNPCNGLAANPSLWPVRLGNDGWRHVGCVNDILQETEKLRIERGEYKADYLRVHKDKCDGLDRIRELEDEIAQLRAPPGADAMEVATEFFPAADPRSEKLARALARHGEQAALIAREGAIAECAGIARLYINNPVGDERNNTAEAFAQGMDHNAGALDNAIAIEAAILALGQKPSGAFRDQSRRRLIHDALSTAAQDYRNRNSLAGAQGEHLCRQALSALADENGAVEAPQSKG